MRLVAIAAGLVFVAVLVALWLRVSRRRAAAANLSDEAIQAEVVAYLAETLPTLTIARNQPRELTLNNDKGDEATMFLDNLIASIRTSNGTTPERRRIYGEFTRPLEFYAGLRTVQPIAEQTAQIFPRVVHREYLEQIGAGDPVHRRIGETPLHVAYVLDLGESVRYILKADLDELKLNPEQLDNLALQNFRPMMPEDSFRQVLTKPGAASVISSGDSFDATRLILLPEYLRPGEVLAVAVPDRDTLVIIPQPDDKAWEALAMIAAKPMSSRIILARPLRVTAMGIEVR